MTFYTKVNGDEAEYSPFKVSSATYCDDAQSDFSSAQAACSGNGAFMAEVRVCPSALPTFGAALGYAGFIELALTIVIVFALQQCGVLRGGPEGYLGQMIKEIADGKDTGKEIGAEQGVAAPTSTASDRMLFCRHEPSMAPAARGQLTRKLPGRPPAVALAACCSTEQNCARLANPRQPILKKKPPSLPPL